MGTYRASHLISSPRSVITDMLVRLGKGITRGSSLLVFFMVTGCVLLLLQIPVWDDAGDAGPSWKTYAGDFNSPTHHGHQQGASNPRSQNSEHPENVVLADDVPQNEGQEIAPQFEDTSLTDRRTLFLITPTYKRPTQRADFTRAAQIVKSIPNCHWLIVEDATTTSPWIEQLLTRLDIKHKVMACTRAPNAPKKQLLANGYVQRNCALDWLRKSGVQDGVIYFIDDDNTYDLRNFEEVRKAQKVALVPTGNLVDSGVSSPLFDNGKIVDWVDPWPAGRKFPTDMACFAIGVGFWLKKGAPKMCDTRGQLETKLLQDLKIPLSEFEPLAENCTKVYGWHTQTSWDKTNRPTTAKWKPFMDKYPNSNLAELQKSMASLF